MSEQQTTGAEIIDHGQIRRMSFPNGWVEGPPYHFTGGIGTRSFREVHPTSAPDAMMCFFYRGLPTNPDIGAKFRRVLEQPPHALNSEELASVSEITRDKNDPTAFTMGEARTEDLNGKRVLVVTGRFNEIQEDIFAIFVDADGSGRIVQEIYFQAPMDLYRNHLISARSAFSSIEWK